ncbi:MAG: hypothetical protein ACAH17_01440 [Candidatus Paceibacterota bacterium]
MQNAVFLADEAKAAAAEEKNEKLMSRTAMLQLIVRGRVQTWRVFGFPVMYSFVVAGLLLYNEGVFGEGSHTPSPAWLVFFLQLIILMAIVIAVQNTRFVAVNEIMKLEGIPPEEWFTISGVEKANNSNPVTVKITDPFGTSIRITYYGLVRTWKPGEDPKPYVVSYLKPKWEPYLQDMGKQKKHSLT